MARVKDERFVLETPEHVALAVELADLGSRLGALVLDLALQLAAIVATVIALVTVAGADASGIGAPVILLTFVVRSFYFTLFEIVWQGRTPAKRALKLRVVARDGGPLTAAMVFARNLTRELETFLPLTALLAPQTLLPGAPGWAKALTVLWVLAFTLLPLFNRYRARLGDLLAGTVVVAEPRPALLPDLAAEARDSAADQEFVFTPAQLALYGIRELQVLEQVLRRPPSFQKDSTLAMISDRVRRKIGWPGDPPRQHERFLQAFYAAQRAHLEHRLLLGERRERKVR